MIPRWKRAAGSRSDIKVEETAAQIDIIDGKPVRRLAGRTDYLLRRPFAEGGEPIPLAIIEAKHEGLPPEHGLQQGKDYRVGELQQRSVRIQFQRPSVCRI